MIGEHRRGGGMQDQFQTIVITQKRTISAWARVEIVDTKENRDPWAMKEHNSIIYYVIQVRPRFLTCPGGWTGGTISHQDQQHKIKEGGFENDGDEFNLDEI